MANEFKGMVELDGVRWRREDLERAHPDRVADAVKIEDLPGLERVSAAPGAVVTGEDDLGTKIIDTTASAAGNGVSDEPGEPDGSGDESPEAGKRPKRRTGTTK